MQEIKLKGVNETVYFEQLENGLPIYIWTSEYAHSFQGVLNVFYGADYLDFTVNHRRCHVHRGTAHYLEHVMCEMDDEPLLVKFNRLGSYSNAHTSYMNTAYEFLGTSKLKENLELLLHAIFEKKFNNEEIEHERTPIIEEQRMRADNPEILSYLAMNDLLYQKYPNKVDLGGTIDDIKQITREELELIYRSFYHPANMTLVVTGNVSPYEVVQIVKDFFKDKPITEWIKPKLLNYKEGKRVHIKQKTIYANVEVPEVTVAVKMPMVNFANYDYLKLINMIRLILASNFSSTTLFKEELLEKKLIYNLYYSAYKMYDYLILEVGCRTKYPEEMADILLTKLKKLTINEEDIERKIKSAISTLVLSYENHEEVNSILSNSLLYTGKIIENEKEMLESISIKAIKEVYQLLSFKEIVTLFVLTKEKKQD